MNTKKTILVVEDFSSIRQYICKTLELKGYHTVDAADVSSACAILLEGGQEVDLVLSDFNMPDGTGLDLLTKLKSNPAARHIPVIFLTTESSPELIRSAKDKGLSTWIKKPYRAEAFFNEIRRVIESSVKTDLFAKGAI